MTSIYLIIKITYIKDLNKYLCRNNKYNNKSYFCPRCLN